MKFTRLFALALAIGSLAGCADSDTTDFRYGVNEALPLAVFPSNRYTTPDEATHTGLRLQLPETVSNDALFDRMPELRGELESLDGFGTSADLWVSFDGPLDASRLPPAEETTTATSVVQVIALEDGARVAVEPVYASSTHTLLLRPVEPLLPKTTYALVLGDTLRDLQGNRLRAASSSWGKASDVRKWLSSKVQPMLVSTFTTQSVTDSLASFGLTDEAHAADELPSAASFCDTNTYAHIGWQGRGHLRSGDYRLDGARFPVSFDDRTGTRESTTAELPYRFFLPVSADAAPIVLVQHGLANKKEGALDCHVADMYAEYGFATIAIDAAWHGERGPDGRTPPALENLHTLFGFKPTADRFVADIRYGRDAIRQTVLDHLQVIALIRALKDQVDYVKTDGTTGADGKPDVSGEFYYNGSSMGGMLGSLSAAVSPHIESAVLNVPGGRIVNFIYKSEVGLDKLFRLIGSANIELAEGDVRRFLALVQTMWERADPINYARRWHLAPFEGRAPKNILIQQTVRDLIMPNHATMELARAGGLPLVSPYLMDVPQLPVVVAPSEGLTDNLADGITGGMTQFDYVQYEGAEAVRAAHGTLNSDQPLRQSRQFFRDGRIGIELVD